MHSSDAFSDGMQQGTRCYHCWSQSPTENYTCIY